MAPVVKMKRTKPSNGDSIKSLPNELLTEILSRVSSNSVADLFNVQRSSKYLYDAGNDNYVLQHACMDSFHIPAWRVCDEASSFLNRCKESGNAEALFKQGLYEYITLSGMESGLELMRRAAQKGHAQATYIYGIVLLLACEDDKRRQGLKLLSCLKKSKSKVEECRKKVKQAVWRLWVRNDFSTIKPARTCNCWNTWSNRGWEEEAYGDTCSESCFWEREATLFYNLIRTYHF